MCVKGPLGGMEGEDVQYYHNNLLSYLVGIVILHYVRILMYFTSLGEGGSSNNLCTVYIDYGFQLVVG